MDVKTKAVTMLQKLPEPKIRVALDFIEYLLTKEEWDATLEIMADEELMAGIVRGKKEIAEGKYQTWETAKTQLLLKEKKKKYHV